MADDRIVDKKIKQYEALKMMMPLEQDLIAYYALLDEAVNKVMIEGQKAGDTPEELIDRIENMNNTDPLQYYIQKMRESVKRKDGRTELGLARINYEGEAKIKPKYFEDVNIIEIKAIFHIT